MIRGNNSHDASNMDIVALKENPQFKQRTIPNVGLLLQKAKDGKADYKSVAEQMRMNSVVRETRIEEHHRQKRAFMESQMAHMKKTDEDKVTIMRDRVSYQMKKQRIELVSRQIEMARRDILLFKDDHDLREDAIERMKKYYDDMDNLS